MPTRNSVTTTRNPAWYGWIPDLPDQRDHLYAKVHAAPKKLPAKVDLRKTCSAIEDQGQLGSCTANALVGALEFLERKQKQPVANLSRLFVYYNERVIEHSVNQDAGAMLRDGIKTLAKEGVCTEKLWPYAIGKFAAKPTSACYAQATAHTISSYQRLSTLSDMRACLASGFPFVFGFTVYDSFESATVASTGVVPLPKKSERVLGGHAVCSVGYDDKVKRFVVRNSWGRAWGQKGYCTMPYAYLDNRDLADDMWTMRKLAG